VHIVGFIIRIYHDARSPEGQITYITNSETKIIGIQFLVWKSLTVI